MIKRVNKGKCEEGWVNMGKHARLKGGKLR